MNFFYLFNWKSYFALNELYSLLIINSRKSILSYCLKNMDEIGCCLKYNYEMIYDIKS